MGELEPECHRFDSPGERAQAARRLTRCVQRFSELFLIGRVVQQVIYVTKRLRSLRYDAVCEPPASLILGIEPTVPGASHSLKQGVAANCVSHLNFFAKSPRFQWPATMSGTRPDELATFLSR